jgi:hypothetical protein
VASGIRRSITANAGHRETCRTSATTAVTTSGDDCQLIYGFVLAHAIIVRSTRRTHMRFRTNPSADARNEWRRRPSPFPVGSFCNGFVCGERSLAIEESDTKTTIPRSSRRQSAADDDHRKHNVTHLLRAQLSQIDAERSITNARRDRLLPRLDRPRQ